MEHIVPISPCFGFDDFLFSTESESNKAIMLKQNKGNKMKTLLITGLLTLAPLMASAKNIDLAPGSSIVVDGDLVTCKGQSAEQLAPVCTIKQDSNYFRVYIGTNIVNSYYKFDDALAGVKELKAAGMCR